MGTVPSELNQAPHSSPRSQHSATGDPAPTFPSPICISLHSLVSLKPLPFRSLWTSGFSYSKYSEGYLTKHTWQNYPEFKEQHRCVNLSHNGICLNIFKNIQKRKLWGLVFCWFGFGFVCLFVCLHFGLVFCRIVYETGKASRNTLALISVLDYTFPMLQRPHQPILPLRPEVRHAASQFLHRQVALCTSSLVPVNVYKTNLGSQSNLFLSSWDIKRMSITLSTF